MKFKKHRNLGAFFFFFFLLFNPFDLVLTANMFHYYVLVSVNSSKFEQL